MKARYWAIVATVVVLSLAVLAIVVQMIPRNSDSAAVASEIKSNALETARNIECYYIKAEIRAMENSETPGCERVDKIEIWSKGPDKYRIDTEITGMENIGIPPTRCTTIHNGRTVASLSQGGMDIYYNCPPFDYSVGQFERPYDMANGLNALIDADLVDVIAEEVVSGEDAYRIEAGKDERTLEGNPDTVERAVRWVSKKNSVCLKKEIYEHGELAGTIEVIDYRMGEDIPDDLFSIDKEGIRIREERDGGYREIALEQAEEVCGFTPIYPGYVPEGFHESSTGWRDPRPSDLPLDLPPEYAPMWYKPFYITYTDSITEINICEARKYDKYAPDIDSLTISTEDDTVVLETSLPGGRTAYCEPDTQTLYFLLKDIKVRIRANLPMEELIRIAESMG